MASSKKAAAAAKDGEAPKRVLKSASKRGRGRPKGSRNKPKSANGMVPAVTKVLSALSPLSPTERARVLRAVNQLIT